MCRDSSHKPILATLMAFTVISDNKTKEKGMDKTCSTCGEKEKGKNCCGWENLKGILFGISKCKYK